MGIIERQEWYVGVGNPARTKKEIEECVKFVRLELYNMDLPCGPQAIQSRLKEFHITPLPSGRTIARILARLGLTHQRTGFYF
jgi:hypothetical protein